MRAPAKFWTSVRRSMPQIAVSSEDGAVSGIQKSRPRPQIGFVSDPAFLSYFEKTKWLSLFTPSQASAVVTVTVPRSRSRFVTVAVPVSSAAPLTVTNLDRDLG